MCARVHTLRQHAAVRPGTCVPRTRSAPARSLAEIDRDPDVKDKALKCLQTYKDELSSDKCKSEVSGWSVAHNVRRLAAAGRRACIGALHWACTGMVRARAGAWWWAAERVYTNIPACWQLLQRE